MFEEKYKKAYDAIEPENAVLNRILLQADSRAEKTVRHKVCFWKPVLTGVAMVLTVVTALSFVTLPVLAAKVPAVYRFIEGISPTLADWVVPLEASCTDRGIKMQVEAIHVEDNQAEIYVSFQDEEEKDDIINGRMDIYEGYGLLSRSGKSSMGGCSFAEYEEETGKAYFKVSVMADEAFDRDKLTFYAYALSVGSPMSQKRPIDLNGILYEADLKSEPVSGRGGTDWENIRERLKEYKPAEEFPDDPRFQYAVMDAVPVNECAADEFTITGIAYLDGLLRVQICMGDILAGRQAQLFLVDEKGNEQSNGVSLSWSENYEGIDYVFYEYYFAGPFEDLDDYSMYGIFCDTGERVEGEWSVTFRVE